MPESDLWCRKSVLFRSWVLLTLCQGAGSAVIGAYVLAGEVSRSQDDIPNALKQYEKILRPYVEKAQRLLPGAPQIVTPQTEWGVWALNKTTGIASSGPVKAVGGLIGSVVGKLLPTFGGTGYPLPDYEASVEHKEL